MSDTRGKILIVDDVIANLTAGRHLLKAHYDIYLASSAAQMFEMLEKVHANLILLDIEMPVMDGYEALAALKTDKRFARIPVIFLTAQSNETSELKGFDLGAADYICKPFSPSLLLKRIEHQLVIAEQRKTIQHHVDNLAVIVSEKVSEVVGLQNALLTTIANLVDFRDQCTGGHIARTQLYLKALIDGLREKKLYTDITSGWDMDYVLQSAQLHDVGKIAISDAILKKPGRLTPEEIAVMKTHVTVGVDAINKIVSTTKSHVFLHHAMNIIGTHHEKWDGTGYPYGLKGEEIPLEGRLMAVADVYDALVSERPYKKAFSHEEARKIIAESAGSHFDPILVDIFLSVENEFEYISQKQDHVDGSGLNLLTLTKDMEIGVSEVDARNRELINKVNNVIRVGTQAMSPKETRTMLDFLREYVIKHFGNEETLQQQSEYPKYEWHKSQHQSFADELHKLDMEFAVHGDSDHFSRKLSNSVVEWVVRHIKLADAEFGKYYQVRATS